MNDQPHLENMAAFKRKRDEWQEEDKSVLKELPVNVNTSPGGNLLTNYGKMSTSDLSKDNKNNMQPVCENEASNNTFSAIKKSESKDSLFSSESEISNGTSFTEEDISGKEMEDTAKIDKKTKTAVKPSLSLDEKLTHLKKLMAISNAYAKYVSTNLQKTSKSEPSVTIRSHDGSTVAPGKKRSSTNSKIQINNSKEKLAAEKECTSADAKFIPPPLFKGTLKPYQKDGCEWLKILFENAASGILADEMGLGKTVQTLAIITHIISKNLKGPFLIVAPLSTLPNWMYEFQRFCPTVPVVLFHGHALARKQMIQSFKLQKLKTADGELKVYPVIVTSYETILMEHRFFGSYNWLYLVVDEGHRLKNKDCKLHRFLSSFSSSNRLLLTGTPLQNTLEELWSLLRFLTPEIFGNIGDLELLISSEDMQSETIVEQEIKEGIVSKLHAALQPFILRRMKKDVNLNLPPKKEILVYAPMSQLQWDLYSGTLDGRIFSILGLTQDEDVEPLSKRKCIKNVQYSMNDDEDLDDDEFLESLHRSTTASPDWIKKKKLPVDKDGNPCYINLKMQNSHFQLRKICNHPYLVQTPIDSNGYMLVNEDMIKKSGKMMILDVLLPRLKARGHKVLIFSTMTKILNVIEEFVRLRNYTYSRLDGSVKLEDRICEMNSFLEDENVFLFLISTRAGNLGLNLISADTVIIFDSDWNPQVDLQAQDRCHRIGQTKPVVVYRFVTKASVDEKIVQYSQAKRKLEKIVLHNDCYKGLDAQKPESFVSVEELRALLHSSDYSKIVNTSGNVMSDQEIEEILDRSDMI